MANYRLNNRDYMRNAYNHNFVFVLPYNGEMIIVKVDNMTTKLLNMVTRQGNYFGEIGSLLRTSRRAYCALIKASSHTFFTGVKLETYKETASIKRLGRGLYAEDFAAYYLGGVVNKNRNISYKVNGDIVIDGVPYQVKQWNGGFKA